MRRVIALLLSAALASIGLTAVAATPAFASVHPQAYGACDQNNYCMWDGIINTETPNWERTPPEMPLNTCIGNLSPVTSMINNDTQYQIYVSAWSDCSGTVANGTVALIHGYSGPTILNSTWNNRIRGFWRTSSIEHCYC